METTLAMLRAALDAAMNAGRELWNLLSADPVTLPALLMAAAAILALVLVATPGTRTTVRRRAEPNKRPAQARSLAASGTPMGEISRRTGLSRDAVATLLTPVANADSSRKGRPEPAPFSARFPFRRTPRGEQATR
jgi:hypothetical protein